MISCMTLILTRINNSLMWTHRKRSVNVRWKSSWEKWIHKSLLYLDIGLTDKSQEMMQPLNPYNKKLNFHAQGRKWPWLWESKLWVMYPESCPTIFSIYESHMQLKITSNLHVDWKCCTDGLQAYNFVYQNKWFASALSHTIIIKILDWFSCWSYS